MLIRRLARESRAGQALLRRRRKRELATWGRSGRTPYQAKVELIAAHARGYGTRVFVETGTYQGEMLAAQLGRFDRLISIEIDGELHAAAARRFRRHRQVSVIRGDSQKVLADVAATFAEPALFWLDAHYMTDDTVEESPILHELMIALNRGHRDVILIDDADQFGLAAGYPTIHAVEELALSLRSDVACTITDGVICITPSP